jgi:hypothetical protein
MLRELGRNYGRDAEYATDGFAFQVPGAQTVVLHISFSDTGAVGSIGLYVLHPDPAKHAQIASSMQAMIGRFLPVSESSTKVLAERDLSPPAGPNPGSIQLFLSHAWPDKWDNQGNPIDPALYSEPVEFIESEIETLSEQVATAFGGRKVLLHYDKKSTFSDLVKFIEKITVSDYIIIVHSDKYWKSAWCMHEFTSARIFKGEEEFLKRIVMVKIGDCEVDNQIISYHQRWQRRGNAYRKHRSGLPLDPAEEVHAGYPAALTRDGYEFVLNNLENAFGTWIAEALGRVHNRFEWGRGEEVNRERIREALRRRLLPEGSAASIQPNG